MLQVDNVHAGYVDSSVLGGISLSVEEGEVIAVIGPNGAGKSTLLKTISGLLKPSEGEITFLNEKLNGLRPEMIVARGIAHVPEGRRVFPHSTVEDNLIAGAYCRTDKDGVEQDLGVMYRKFPRLTERRRQQAGSLSGGEQQMLVIARGLMSRPKLLLMDEVSLGLAPIVVSEVFAIVEELRDKGLSMLLVEQDAVRALSCANRAYVLSGGEIVMEGMARDLLQDETLSRAYLGVR